MNTELKKQSWFSSVFAHIILIFFLTILCMFGVSFWLYQRANQTTRKQIYDITWQQMTDNIEQFDQQLDMLIKMQQYFSIVNEDLIIAANYPYSLSLYEKGILLNGFQQQFMQIKIVANYVEDVRLHLPLMNRTVTSMQVQSSLDWEEVEYLNSNYDGSSQILYYNGKVLSVMSPFYMPNHDGNYSKPSYYLVVELSNSKVFDHMIQDINNTETSTIICDDSASYVLYSMQNDLAEKVIDMVLNDDTFEQDVVSIDGQKYFVLKKASQKTGLNLIKYMEYNDTFKALKTYQLWLIFFVILSILAWGYFSWSIYHHVQKPVHTLLNAFNKVENGDFNTSIQYSKNDEFRYLYKGFANMVMKIKNLIEQVYEQKILSEQAKLKQLQSQINPHFLYNSLFIISVMAKKGDMDFIEQFAEQLGKYFRFLVKNDREMIPLREEMEYARLYADIQEKRFSNRLQISIEDVPEELQDYAVPRLIIQPLIENAFAYALEDRSSCGRLNIYYKQYERFFEIYVEDNGKAMDDETYQLLSQKIYVESENIPMSGVSNIHRRLKIQFGPDSGIILNRLEAGGLQVILRIYREAPSRC